MSQPSFLDTAQGRKIAYHQRSGEGTGVVFLGGFQSDMEGTKALYLDEWAAAQNRPFVRFDYSGHGSSSGDFADGCIGDWAADAAAVIETLCDGPQLLIGSSMGGWIALLMAKRLPTRCAGVIGIAAAPDFTQGMWDEFTDAQRKAMVAQGRIEVPSPYADTPDILTHKLIEEGRENFVMNAPLQIPGPLHLLHGTADDVVPVQTASQILEHADCPQGQATLVKGVDHRFSDPACLALIVRTADDLLKET